jgi:transposase-like protein
MQKTANANREALARVLAQDYRTVEDIQEMIQELFKDTVEQVLEAEMDEHLGYEKHNVEGNKSGNSREAFH